MRRFTLTFTAENTTKRRAASDAVGQANDWWYHNSWQIPVMPTPTQESFTETENGWRFSFMLEWLA